MLLRRVELPDGISDVAIRDGRITAIAAHLDTHIAGPDATVIDGHGGALIPGLHDHHIHLFATAAAADSIHCGPPEVRTREELARVLRNAPGNGWIRGVGYVETVAGPLDSRALDRIETRRPMRIQHRSGALWVLNSVAAALVGLDGADHPGIERDNTGAATGRLFRADNWLRDRLPDDGPPDLRALGARLARFGITGVTEATPDLSPVTMTALIDAHVKGAIPQRLHLLGAPIGVDTVAWPATVTVGPSKIVLADSGLPDFSELVETIRRAHDAGRAVAVHCVSRIALVLLVAALDEAGAVPGDRIEHGSVIPAELVGDLARNGICVVTQPGFLAHRGDDYLERVDADDLPDLYRCRSLLDGGVGLALSSDAPYGPLDPWTVISAAADRRAPTGVVVGPEERIGTDEALVGYLTRPERPGRDPRTVEVGASADLVLLDRALREELAEPTSESVRCTIVRGEIVYQKSHRSNAAR
ncbi:hypothetical protein GORHZ_185_00450 [Gordonia rhizosphera NBRC 16068]|uniref:Amidohydrolase 3 domain-containing protein n=2 Tax=Gordonia rhizosphera TaxID=83341 RepID=K6X1E4_9ACTN|nr:hypothetical protein GORHZ_185_00450 [Gordonia rhizosphera NBRC 16068]